MNPWPAFDAITPLGIAEVIGCQHDGPDLIWLCAMVETGELFCFRNLMVRRSWDLTSGNALASKFTFKPEPKLQAQIDRYIKGGWLPNDWMTKRFEGSGGE